MTSLKSSRAGHVLELQYGSDATLIGANILDYRLERSRITKVPTAERNFHVFYYLISGVADSEREHLALSELHSAKYKYLGHQAQLRTPIDDKQKFSQLKASLKALEFSRADIANICQVLAAIVHIGQLTFKSTGSDGTSGPSALVDNVETLEYIASFLGVRSNLLENALSYKTVYIKNDRVTLVLDQKGARENADELARALYTMLFMWIMEQINSSLSQDRNATSSTGLQTLVDNTISVVDFPGFTTSTSVPTIDKLLHNSANEILYNYLLKSYFELPVEKFLSEEVTVPISEYFDNSDTVRTLFRHSLGALSVIDDYSRREKDDQALMETFRKRYDKNPSLDAVSSNRSFTVRHFAGEVEYMVEDGFLASNSDVISGDIINLFTSSSSSDFLQAVFSSAAVVDSKYGSDVVRAHLSSKPLRAPSTVRRNNTIEKSQKKKKLSSKSNACGQFVTAIDNLIDSFEGANPYFILCLKPNDRRQAKNIDARCVRQQIKAFGIPEIAQRVKQTDFSVFLPFNQFIRYSHADGAAEDPGISERDQAIRLIQTKGWSDRDARYGLSGVFLSENAWLQLVDPNMSFVENANQRYDAGNPYVPYGEGDGYYYDADNKSLNATGGDMFRFNDSKSVSKEAFIHAKDVGEGDEDQVDIIKITRARRTWMFIVWLLTWWIPDFFIKFLGKMPRKDIRVAWREKLAINILIWLSCAAVILFLVGFPILICPTQNVLTPEEITGYSFNNNPDKTYGAIRGYVFDLTKFAPGHYPSIVPTKSILDYGGGDMTNLFPIQLSAVCEGTNGSIDSALVYGSAVNYTDTNAQYHDFRSFLNDSRPDWYLEQMMFLKSNYKKSYMGYTRKHIKALVSDKKRSVASINGYLYDVTSYLAGDISVRVQAGKEAPSNVNRQFMDSGLMSLFQSFNGQDITSRFKSLSMDNDVRNRMTRCLDNVFMIGKVDTRDSVRCMFARYFLLAISIFLVAIMLFKFIAALQFGKKSYPEDLDNFVMLQVPAYTEDEESLRRAIDSLARTKYDDKRKLLIVICDGMIVGAGNDRPTPRIVLDILGSSRDVNPPALSVEGLGEGQQQHNMGKVYSGLYEVQGHIVPYIVLVKVGKPTEINKPGNRGKRDSQMLLMRFLNRVHYNLPMSPMELELYHQIQNVIGVNPAYYEYLLQVDADTMVSQECASQMVSAMNNNNKVQALCGETGLSNARASIITMMQVYEYYISHNLAKAFESLFGSVTCLPGCFSMYRIYQTGSGKPVFVSHPIVRDYSENRVDTLHMKNLLHLGEDRYLTTLLLKHNSHYKTKFLRVAEAWTVAPDTWSVFLSQRRRWINSTVHNLFELIPLSQLCGFCCFSMRFIVMLDLLSTIVQPVTLGYLVYLFYLIGSSPDNIPVTSIILLAAVYGLQALIFLVRRKWEMIGWMIFYIIGLPIFSLAVPLYSFWHMDDFSWGNTRVVVGEKGNKIVVTTEGKFDPSEIPLQRWAEYQSEAWNHFNNEVAKNGAPSTLADAESIAGRSYTPSQNVLAKSVYSMPFDSRAPSRVGGPGAEAYEMSTNIPSDEVITAEIKEILSTADLMTVTKKSIRQSLEAKFGVKLTAKRDYINYVTEAVLTGEL
ncbi:hypothetical protein DV451_003900 [Geotrichum candidum]|uniref:chitin synthase n=1 Tax=Geotrichum candidum TaxID=1173061 RepID=A0A9P5G3H5_GEOCN|nr:hypothetical protein DV451_003900 [Geotrichum candidum]KAF5110653.1 hypothetical protein DV453_000710 [Geotrichum candidum]